MKILKQLVLTISLVVLSISLEGAFPAAAVAGTGQGARPAAAAVGLSAEALAQRKAEQEAQQKAKEMMLKAIQVNKAEDVKIWIQQYPDLRQEAMRHAARQEKPAVLLALLPEKEAHEADEIILRRHFYAIQDLTVPEIKTYRQALTLIKQKQIAGFNATIQGINQSTPLVHDIAHLAAQTLYPTLKKQDGTVVPTIHPELEHAIITGNLDKVKTMAQSGWLTEGPDRGSQAFALAVEKGQAAIVARLFFEMPLQELQKLFEKARAEAFRFLELAARGIVFENNLDTKQMAEQYKHTALMLKSRITNISQPNKPVSNILLQDTALLNAVSLRKETGIFLKALERGANPWATLTNPYNRQRKCTAIASAVMHDNPVYLQMLIDAKQYTTGIFADNQGRCRPVLVDFINRSKPGHAQVMLDAGFDPNALDPDGKPIAWHALQNNDPQYLRMLLNTGKVDPNTTIKDVQGRAYPLLIWAISRHALCHAKELIENLRCNVNALDSDGKPVVWHALHCPHSNFLRMLLNTKKVDLNTTIKDDKGIAHPLLAWAMFALKSDKWLNTHLLLSAGCNPNALDGYGQPVLRNALLNNDPRYLQLFIDTGKLDRNTTIKDDKGVAHPLLAWAIQLGKRDHARLLLDSGFDHNAADGYGNFISSFPLFQELFEERQKEHAPSEEEEEEELTDRSEEEQQKARPAAAAAAAASTPQEADNTAVGGKRKASQNDDAHNKRAKK